MHLPSLHPTAKMLRHRHMQCTVDILQDFKVFPHRDL